MTDGTTVRPNDHARHIFYPRWPLLGALILSIAAPIGYGLWSFYQDHLCPFGGLCQSDTWNPNSQIIFIWAAYALCCFVALRWGLRPLEAPQARHTSVERAIIRFFGQISEFGPVRWLLVGYGGVALLGIVVMFFAGRFQQIAFAFGGILIFVALCTLAEPAWRGTPVAHIPDPIPAPLAEAAQLPYQHSAPPDQNFPLARHVTTPHPIDLTAPLPPANTGSLPQPPFIAEP